MLLTNSCRTCQHAIVVNVDANGITWYSCPYFNGERNEVTSCPFFKRLISHEKVEYMT